eukprot:7979691-Ditylum_brightwellii.AAC.1
MFKEGAGPTIEVTAEEEATAERVSNQGRKKEVMNMPRKNYLEEGLNEIDKEVVDWYYKNMGHPDQESIINVVRKNFK